MNPASSKNGAAPPPSAETLAIEQRIAELQERRSASLKRDKAREDLRQFVADRPALDHRDLLALAQQMRPQKTGKAVTSRMKPGYAPPKVAPVGKIGKAIDAALKDKNLSRAQLASLIGASPQAINNWYADRNAPTNGTAKKLAKTLGRPAEVFQ
jgi:ribosome-binding protein aMBF1 (putative translation factor)